jgi:hypothetical protein
MNLQNAVEQFGRLTWQLTDADLERPWQWGEYDEGVRFAFFRVYEELRDLAVALAARRLQAGQPQTQAQRILAQYHAAYQDFRAVVFGVSDELAGQPPAEGEWPLRTILLHFVKAERAFFAVTQYAVGRSRVSVELPLAISDEGWDEFWAGDPFDALKENGTFSVLLNYYAGLHQRILDFFADTTDAELNAPAVFWENTPMPVQFRLHRFDSHLRQHTVQAEKALTGLNFAPNEARHLLRLIFAALAEVQGVQIGAGEAGVDACHTLAAVLEERCTEIAAILNFA